MQNILKHFKNREKKARNPHFFNSVSILMDRILLNNVCEIDSNLINESPSF